MGLLRYKKTYVLAPYHSATGGPELAHQLVDYLRNESKEAYIVYYLDNGETATENLTVTKQYQKYNIEVASHVKDERSNVLIVPETCQFMIPWYKNIQICIWWMSVDNAFKGNLNFFDTIKFKRGILNKLRVVKYFRKYVNNYSLKKLKQEDYRLTHFYQSTYAQQYLYGLGLNRVIRLTDYINPDILTNVNTNKKKENIILYNPSKGFRYTKKLIERMKGYKFIALKGFDRTQLNDLFDISKLYIDFGDFPGNDRLPREAAIHNCCIITGMFGASRFYEDVPIDNKYKFDMTHADYKGIRHRIDDIFENYEDRVKDFDYMRENIMKQQECFYREINNIFF